MPAVISLETGALSASVRARPGNHATAIEIAPRAAQATLVGPLRHWSDWLVGLGFLIPLSFVPLTAAHGGGLLRIPYQHFFIVSGVSMLATVVAIALAVATLQIGVYRVLFLCLGFASMSGIFAVHGLTTPGIIVPHPLEDYSGGAVAVSAYLSLAIPALFFAASYLPGLARLERRLPLWPAGWLLLVVALALAAYAATAIFNTGAFARLPLSAPPYTSILAIGSIGLFLFAAIRQAHIYRVTRLASQAGLIAAFVLLADAAAAMVLFPVWTLGWWYYHLLMLAAVSLALRALLLERAQGSSLRSVVEAALELEVSVDIEALDVEVVAALVAAVEVKDRDMEGHNRRVAELSVAIGRQLGMGAPELRVLARSGLLHDIGKLGIPDAILQKDGALSASEWQVMKTHPEIALAILGRVGHFKRELLAVLYHHERMDGSGYPHGLAAEAIPIEARIVAVADTYDALTSGRSYRKGCDRSAATCILREESGSHLDPRVVNALIRSVEAQMPTSGAGRDRLETAVAV